MAAIGPKQKSLLPESSRSSALSERLERVDETDDDSFARYRSCRCQFRIAVIAVARAGTGSSLVVQRIDQRRKGGREQAAARVSVEEDTASSQT